MIKEISDTPYLTGKRSLKFAEQIFRRTEISLIIRNFHTYWTKNLSVKTFRRTGFLHPAQF